MIMKANKQIGFIYKDNESIDKILKDGDVVFERGFLREKTSTTLPITFDGVGKNLKDYKIYGNTYQNSTSGKNLYGISDYSNTVNGVEITIKDGVITLNGTCTAATTLYINSKSEQNLNGNYNMTLNLLSGTYTGTANINLRNANDDTVIDGTQLSFNILNKGFTLQNKNIKYGIYFVKNAVFNNFKFRPQLVIGTDPDYDYEPYTGGQPSPNPDYPQEIISCGDRTSNLFSSKMELGTINDSGQNANSENVIRTKDYIEVNPNTTYTMSNDKNYRIFLYQYDENNDYVTHSNNYGGYITFTTASNTKYVKARTNAGTIENDLTSLWKLAEGSTVTPYEPYGYKIPVNVRSENLATNLEFAWYSGVSQKFTTSYNFKRCTAKIKPNTTYTITKKNASNRFVVITSEVEIAPTVPYKRTVLIETNTNRTRYTFTTQADENYLFFGYYSGTDETEIELAEEEIMIVEGSTAPSKYIPYYSETTNIYLNEPLRKIGDYSDYIDFINGKVVRNIKEIILDGSENWVVASAGQNAVRFVWNTYQGAKIPSSSNIVGAILSNKFIPRTANETNNKKDGIAIAESGKFVIYYESFKENTSTQFKTWLSSNNVTVNYALATPTEETITLPNIPTVDKNNTLNIETEITPSQVYIKYKSNN